MNEHKVVDIVGGGLAGSEAALQLASRGIGVRLFEMRPEVQTDVHRTGGFAELVCSNSLKGQKPESAAGMLKFELATLGSKLLAYAHDTQVAAGGALAVDRTRFSDEVSTAIENNPNIQVIRGEVLDITSDGAIHCRSHDGEHISNPADAIILASGPLTGNALATFLENITGREHLAFFDAAAPIVMADSLDETVLFRQSRYEENAIGDYLNAPFSREQYDAFIDVLVHAERVIARDFEAKDLFNACQPIEEIARKSSEAPRHGTLKPVGLIDPRTGKRPWAALQLRAENADCTSYNLVGFQTNLKFPEQQRVFRMIPGLEYAEFARYGVMHRNTFLDAPQMLSQDLRLTPATSDISVPVYVAGQLSGTEGYCEAIMSGLVCAISVSRMLAGKTFVPLPTETAFGSLIAYATNPTTASYQPMHVNFGIFDPLATPIRNKRERYAAFAARGKDAIEKYAASLVVHV